MEYPWYAIVSGEQLQQGDILREFPQPYLELKPSHIKELRLGKHPDINIKIKTQDVIVMTQSCDLENSKVDNIILCPIYNLAEIESELGNSKNDIRGMKEKIRTGAIHSMHMLNKSDAHEIDLQVVGFRNLFSIAKEVAATFAKDSGDRARLLPPYREHLSQAFARYFMRVGLPSDIGRFK